MKRSSKIFALVLSLALILGALAIATFADASDIAVLKQSRYDGLETGKSNTASDTYVNGNGETKGLDPSYDATAFVQGLRAGKIEVKEGSDGNKYVLITQEDKKGSSGPYASLGSGANVEVKNDALVQTKSLLDYKYMSFEIDVMSPTGKFIAGNIDLGGRCIPNGKTARDFWNTNATSQIVKFGSDDNGNYIYDGYDATVKKYINPYEFTNIQCIVENLTTEASTNIEIQTHVYVNGELFFTRKATNVPTSYYNNELNAALIEARFNYLAAEDETVSTAIDNLVWKAVPKGSETVIEELLTYDEDNRPAGLVVATVNGKDYNTLEGAIAAAAEGSTINVLVDKYTPTTVNKKITLDAGDNFLNIVAGANYTVLSGNGIYKVKEGGAAGITTKKTTDMQNATVSGDGIGKAPGSTNYAWSVTYTSNSQTLPRRGTYSIGSSADGNKYVVFTQTGGNTNAGYIGTGYGAVGTTFAGARPTVTAEGVYSKLDTNNEYLVFDIDVMAPSGNYTGFNINLELRGFKAGDTGIDVLNTTSQQGVWFDGNTVKKAGVAEKAVEVNPYEFTHITVIYDKVVADGYVTVDSYLYINGEFFGYTAGTDITGGKGASFYQGSTPHLVWEEVRVNFPSADDATKTLAMDNVVTRLISDEYNGNLASILADKADLDTWESSIYDPDFKPAGIPVAKIGDVEYGNINDAIKAAGEEDEIELLVNIPGEVYVDKAVTVKANGFNIEFATADGFAAKEEDGKYIIFDVSDLGFVDIYWDYECYCEDPDACVNSELILYYEETGVGLYTKFFDLYNPLFVGALEDGKLYQLVGWNKVIYDDESELGFILEKINEDSYVTEEDIEMGYVVLAPIFEEATGLAFQYVAGGEIAYAANDVKLADVIAAADAGSTIKFLADYKSDAVITISKAITLDLNGKTYDATQIGASKSGGTVLKIAATGNLTITSSVEGGKIFGGTSKTGGNPFITTSGNGATITFKGAVDGKNTLSAFVPTLVQAWSNNDVKFYIDGGEYYRIRQDNSGFIQLQGSFTSEVKNAIIYDFGGEMFHLPGRYAPAADGINSTVVVDNCVLIAKGTVMNHTFKEMEATFTNNYIIGKFGEKVYSGETAGYITFGAGNYCTDALPSNAKFVAGYNAYDLVLPYATKVAYNTFTGTAEAIDPSTYVINEYTVEAIFTKVVATEAPKLATITWKAADGTVLGTSEALPGTVATAPADLKAVGIAVEGWLAYVPAEWETSLTVPAGATEYEIVAKEGGAVKYIANVDLLFNIRLTTHFEYLMYIPEVVEGIEITGVNLRGDRLARYNDYLSGKLEGGKAIINGKTYVKVDGWPGMQQAAKENSTCGITFTYEGQSYNVSTTINMPKYATYVLENVGPDAATQYSEEAAVLVVNVINYLYEGCKLLNDTATADTIKDIVANNTSRIISIPDAEKTAIPDTTAMQTYISGVTLHIEAYGPRFRFALTDAGKAAEKITVYSNGNNIIHGDTNTQAKYSDKGYVETNNTRVEFLNKTTVTVTPAEGEAVAVTWTLTNYYAALAATGASEATLSFVDALYGYTMAGARY